MIGFTEPLILSRDRAKAKPVSKDGPSIRRFDKLNGYSG